MSVLSLESLCLADNDSPSSAEDLDLEDKWDTDLEIDEVKKTSKDTSTAEIYLQACKLVGVVPVSYFLRNLGTSTMNLNHHGLGPPGGKALAIALVTDMHITNLELADNYLLAEGARYLLEMLKANFTIQHLNNYRVKELDLSHNQFCGRGGEHLGQMLANNEALEVLDLSWNHLRMKGAVAFCAGLKVNVTLKHLDLSWNGFGNEGALALGEALKFNNTLVYLDLNNNRITNEGVGMLCKGLEANDTLRALMLAYNSLTVEGALALITVVKNTPKTALEEINISNVLVNENFVQLLDLTCQEHPSLEVQYAGVGGFIAKKPPKRLDPMKVIQDYLDERKLRLWDFFRKIDKDGTMRVPVADFRKAVQQSNIPLDRYQIEELIQRLDRERTGMVDYRGLADTRKQMMRDHRRQLRKVESRQKKEKQKSERILKTFQSAVEANTPRSSMVMSPGGTKEDSSGPQHFSATPLSSWHHIVMSNSSRYSVTNLSSEHIHLPMLGGSTHQRPTSSPTMRSYSQPNLMDDSQRYPQSKPSSAQGMLSDSNPDVDHTKLSPTANHLTRSSPALNSKQPDTKTKTTNFETYENKLTVCAENIVTLTVLMELMEKNPDAYSEA
nr:leucine-rich repeat-containing protein 74A-like [Salvelinus alpinus]